MVEFSAEIATVGIFVGVNGNRHGANLMLTVDQTYAGVWIAGAWGKSGKYPNIRICPTQGNSGMGG